MGTTLTGTTPQDTYDSLIKVTDNGPLSGTAKYLSDGLGNDSVLALSTSAVGIGTTNPAHKLAISSATDADLMSIVSTASANTTILRFGIDGNDANITASGGSTGNLVFKTYGSERMRLDGSVLRLTTAAANQGVIQLSNSSSYQVRGGDSYGYLSLVAPILRFDANGSEAMRITSARNVGIGLSNPNVKLDVLDTMRVQASGQGIFYLSNGVVQHQIVIEANPNNKLAFKWNGTERMALTTDGLTFNGDSAAANALDDYEEGTWTMGVSFGGASTGVTYGFNTGSYTKIGRQVTVTGYCTLTSKGSATGAARITGLPFAIASANSFYSAPTLYFENTSFANAFQGFGVNGSTTIALYETTEAGTVSVIVDTDFSNSSAFIVSFTYFV